MFFQAGRLRESRYTPILPNRLEPIRYSPKEQRQQSPEVQLKAGMFISAQFGRKPSQDKRKLSTQAEKRPRSSLNVFPRAIRASFGPQFTYYCETGNNGAIVRKVMQGRGWFTEQQTNFNVNFIWKQSNRGFNYSSMSVSKRVCINHVENHHEISNKNKLYDNLRLHAQRMKINIDEFVPATYIINLDSSNLQHDLKKFIDYFSSIRKEPTLKNAWLLKPPDLNRGRGIQLFSDLRILMSQIEEFCKQKPTLAKKLTSPQKGARNVTISYPEPLEKSGVSVSSFIIEPTVGSDRVIVLQKYLETPLLYNGRKFDFRVWVMIDHQNKYYFFREGYLRLSTDQFDLHNLRNHYIHLTNNAVQKNHPNYGKYELGNQLSFPDLQQYLNAQKNTKITTKSLVTRMKELIHQTIQCANGKLRDIRKEYQFEIFGYDFMVEKNGSIWLIEINTNPCLEESSPLLQKLIPRMLNDGLRLTVDKIFQINKLQQENLNNLADFPIPGYNDRDNLWELMGQI